MRVLVIVAVLVLARVAAADGHLSLDARGAPVIEATVDGLAWPGRDDITLNVEGRSTPALGARGKPDQRHWQAAFDVSKLDVFDGQTHAFRVETSEGNTNEVMLRFSPAGAPIPLDFQLRDVGPTPSWEVALFGLAELLMLVIAYRVALRESAPGPR